MSRAIVFVLFFLSGISALIYEVLWVRMLGLALGVTVYAASLVLTAYMAGLATGSAWWGRFIDKKKSAPLKLYACLELAIAASALCVSLIFLTLGNSRLAGLSPFILYPAVFCLLLIPTFFMGGTLPVLTKFMVKQPEQTGRDSGMLYAVNTFGGVCGCFLAGFYFIKAFGVTQSMVLSVIITLIAGFSALVLNGRISRPFLQEPDGVEEHLSAPSAGGQFPASIIAIVMALYGISGFCALGYEVLWTRSLMFTIGNDTYAFCIMLGTFLLGLGGGGFLFSRVVFRKKDSLLVLGILQMGLAIILGIIIFGGLAVSYRLDSLIDYLWMHIGKSWLSAVGARLVGAGIVMGIPAFLLGGMFPMVARVCAGGLSRLGGRIGGLYSLNTAGAIAGAALTGFVILPQMGIAHGILLLVCINACIGGIFLFLHPSKIYRPVGVSLSVLIVIACIFATHREPLTLHLAGLERTQGPCKLLYYKEGMTATVSVVKNRTGDKMLNVNGVYTAFATVGDLQVHQALGLLPYLFCRDPQKALVIGLGLGVTSATLCAAGMKVDCVELAREERGTIGFFSEYDNAITSQPGFRLIINDGRHHLLTCHEKYDVITSNAVHVRMSPYLYTKEFYGLCKKKLTEGGVVCQWLPTNNIPDKEFRQLIGAFRAVFPHASVWYVNPGHFLLVGTDSPLRIDYGQFASRMRGGPLVEMLRKVKLENPAIVASLLLMDEEGVGRYVGDAAPHSDNHPCAEFIRTVESAFPGDLISFPPELCARSLPLTGTDSGDDILDAKRAFAGAPHSRSGESAFWSLDYATAAAEYAKALEAYTRDDRTGLLFDTLKSRMVHRGDWCRANNRYADAMDAYNRVLKIDSQWAQAYNGIGMVYKMEGRADSAMLSFQKAAALHGGDPSACYNLAITLMEQGNMEAAGDEYQKTIRLDTTFADAYFNLGYCRWRAGNIADARKYLEHAVALGLDREYEAVAHLLLGH